MLLRWTGVAFALGAGIHGLDHLRRGFDAPPPEVFVIGSVQFAFVALAAWMSSTGHRHAPLAAILVGFGSALLFTSGHLLPGARDSFLSPPATNVTWLSWATAVGEIGTAITFGIAGILARKDAPRPAEALHAG